MGIIIRTETSKDIEQVFDVNRAAFGNRDDEAQLVERIRRSEQFVAQLSIVAERDGDIIGHLLLSKAEVVDDESRHEVIVLAPIAVLPNVQKLGVGTRLIEEGLKRCKELGYGLVLLIGHPDYYPRFGFRPARSFGLELRQFEVPDDVFMVCELQENALRQIKGELRYPVSFFDNSGSAR
ncbi:N-acetyltransferase [Paenibacillus sp. LHD-117]|uniref:GNAT family N-acetyltransferase n=1 Tax=Paenibacillus sp. LHD-117 TaxID=3071412 RepID=UPI0027DF5955|nr:N-acetyltransferase [Paenibacillus sp. LHD-117]MDQ6421754.1 N-acetyltransferase [Paenibacillus sp. LHD-117]